jgi:hypothetical protein
VESVIREEIDTLRAQVRSLSDPVIRNFRRVA